ncbi:MAG: DNA repair and recombination protein RadA [Candidatus Thermoplasmatota archaeon]|nr:DNA repair and recombination protein RadA [Candidatus Thermoplasmatota archaeon]
MAKKKEEEEVEEQEELVVNVDDGPEYTIDDLPGVGPATAEKLREAGFDDLMAIAVMNPADLADQAELGEAVSSRIINGARKMASIGGFLSGIDILEKRREVLKLTSGCQSIDELLGGGFETKSITELYGEFGSGKTQFSHQLAVNAMLPLKEGGLSDENDPAHVFFIDTEDTLRPERIRQMAAAKGLNPDEVLKRCHVARAYNSAHQMLLVDEVKKAASGINVQMIVVDSVISHFRAEFIGRGMLANRQQKLNRHLKELKQLSDVNNAVVLICNQVMSKPDAMWGDPTKAVGGHIISHASAFRIYLRKAKAGRRIARLVDSPNLPEGEAVFSVIEDGLTD